MSSQSPPPGSAEKKVRRVTLRDLHKKKRNGTPITMVTAYDLSSARFVDRAGIDTILVGDSLGMVVLGHESTVRVTMEDMVRHTRATTRAVRRAFVISDLPFMSYQVEPAQALRNAARLMQEGGADAVKLEGGRPMAKTVRPIVDAGIPVLGHIGLTPQSLSKLGGYVVQGKSSAAAMSLLDDALALEDAGCFGVVFEMVPAPVASAITQRLQIPTIGIGAGAGCDGQVLVYHDMLGLFDDFQPRFLKRYAELGPTIVSALEAYRQDVESRSFPAQEHTYPLPDDELAAFEQALASRDREARAGTRDE